MIYKDKELNTMGDMMSIISDIVNRNDDQEALHFMDAYRQQFPNVADVNIGYLLGYLSYEYNLKGQKLFNVTHPIFGSFGEKG